MDDKELEQALKCDAAVPPEAKGIVDAPKTIDVLASCLAVMSDTSRGVSFYTPKEQPVFGHEQAEALFANLVDRVVKLEEEVAALKAAKV